MISAPTYQPRTICTSYKSSELPEAGASFACLQWTLIFLAAVLVLEDGIASVGDVLSLSLVSFLQATPIFWEILVVP
jgi:hypothetical protein